MVGGRREETLSPSRLFQCVFNIHSPEPQPHLGEPGKAFLITIMFAKVKKSKEKNKNKQTNKKSKKKKKKSYPGLCFKPLRGEVAPWVRGSLGSCQADLWARRAVLLCPALQCGVVLVGCGSGHVAKAVGTGQGVCHTLHTSGPSRGTAGPSGPGQWAW